jgi:hypothetical protein
LLRRVDKLDHVLQTNKPYVRIKFSENEKLMWSERGDMLMSDISSKGISVSRC